MDVAHVRAAYAAEGVTETVPLSSKAPKARKRVTEAVEPANGRSIAEYAEAALPDTSNRLAQFQGG